MIVVRSHGNWWCLIQYGGFVLIPTLSSDRSLCPVAVCLLKFMQHTFSDCYFGIISAANLLESRSRRCRNFRSRVCFVSHTAASYTKFIQLLMNYSNTSIKWLILALCNLNFLTVKVHLSWRGCIDQLIWQTSTSIPSDGHIIWLVVCVFFWMSKVLSTTHYDFMRSLSKEITVEEISPKIK